MLTGQYFTNSYNGLSIVPSSVSGSNIAIGTSETGPTFTGTGNASPIGFAGNNQIVGSNTIYQPTNELLVPKCPI